ncbi:MAG: cytochrome P450 [Chloroflexi bacterium]|nr:cytochrome P450 [Chloroflexota bacterium]
MSLDISSVEYRQDPYSVYRQVREENAISMVTGLGGGKSYFLSRYDDVVSVLKDTRFSNERHKVSESSGLKLLDAWWMPNIFKAMSNSMIMVDDPSHARLRNLVHKAFTPRMIQQMGTRVEEISNQLLDDAAKQKTTDFIRQFALPLPLTVISEMMGVPAADRDKFHKWTANFIDSASSANPITMLPQLPNAIQMNRFFRQLMTLRRTDPQDDLITALVRAEEAGDKLNEDELVAMLFILLLAGHETTVNLLGNGILALLQHPDQFEKLKANPDLIDTAIEEILRFTNPVQQIAPRYALEDVELHGQRIPKGSSVMCGVASANRDETIFANADQFDIARNPNRHIAFGLGIHYCVGAPLARLEGKIALQVLLKRYPNLQLAIPESQLQWRGGGALRGLKSLPLYLNA